MFYATYLLPQTISEFFEIFCHIYILPVIIP